MSKNNGSIPTCEDDVPRSKKPSVCVDFDGVIASWEHGTFHKPGPPIEGSREFLADLAKFATVIVYTCRTNSDLYDGVPASVLAEKIVNWLDIWGFSKSVAEVYVGPGKPLASAYIDDRAVVCTPERYVHAYAVALTQAQALCEGHPQPDGEAVVVLESDTALAT